VSGFVDGSTLPEYTTPGSLFRGGDNPARTGDRVHVTKTNDAEHLADLWGTLQDGEPVTSALLQRFVDFAIDHFGRETVATLRARSRDRYDGAEVRVAADEETRRLTHFEFGHTGVAL